MDVNIRRMETKDLDKVLEIYQEGLDTNIAACKTCAPDKNSWDKTHLEKCRFVAEINNKIIGWAALASVSSNCIFSGVAEVSIYISKEYRHKSIGKKLMTEIIKTSEESGIWTLEGEIMQENISSLALCIKSGFRLVGYKEKIARNNKGEWINIVLMERRSNIIDLDKDANCGCSCCE
jgi:phosphinothricin acetyltransferase